MKKKFQNSIPLALTLLMLSAPVSALAKEYSKWNPLRYVMPVTEEPAAPARKTQEPEKSRPVAEPRDEQSAASEAGELNPDAATTGALIETSRGNIVVELFPNEAPVTVENFTRLVRENFYNVPSMKFHRVVPGFVVQTGDPSGTGAGGSRKTIPLEVKNKLSHNARGVVAMARGLDPDSATSQFYITLAPQPSLDGKYAIFGRVISGLDVLDKITQGDSVYGVRLIDTRTVTPDPETEKKSLGSSLKGMLGIK